jgi:hypothetical protein
MLTDAETIGNRRTHERFPLVLKVKIEVVTSGERRMFNALSRDVSAGGTFLHTREFIPEGTEVRLDLALPNKRLKEITGAQTLIKVHGKVVRSDPTGMAISFDRNYKILGVKSRKLPGLRPEKR